MSRTEKSFKKKKTRNYCSTLGFGRLLKTIRTVSLFLTTQQILQLGCIRIKLLVEGIKIIITRLKPEYRRYFGGSGLDR